MTCIGQRPPARRCITAQLGKGCICHAPDRTHSKFSDRSHGVLHRDEWRGVSHGGPTTPTETLRLKVGHAVPSVPDYKISCCH